MAEAPTTSIEASSSVPAASSAPSTPPDPTDDAVFRPKGPWSQIVRGSSNPSPSKTDLQPEETAEKHPHHHPPSELRVTDTAVAVAYTPPISPPSADRRQGLSDMSTEKHTVLHDRLFNDSVQVDTKQPQQSPVKGPKPAWGKPVLNSVLVLEPEPVMGAVTWPALSEARSSKPLESSKAGISLKGGLKSQPLSSERHHLQERSSSLKEIGLVDSNHKRVNQVMANGSNPPIPVSSGAASPSKSDHSTDAEQSKWSGGRDSSRHAGVSEGSPMLSKSNVTSPMHNKESGRNILWEHGRGNHSFPAYGRAHTNAREHNLPGHHQRVGQRNLPQPFVPFINPNPGFVHPAGYQNVPGSMYYVPAPTAEPVLGATYFVPPAVQGMYMPGPDFLNIQGLVMKQIEYYFSVENLCRDIYLRSKMDEWGFVPVSVIANFNRVKILTQNPYFIIEALRFSNVLEVQGDKVRKKGDWANWLLPSNQPSKAAAGDRDQAVRSSVSFRKEADASKSDNSRSFGADNQSNGHVHITSQSYETIEAHSVLEVNVQGVSQDSFLHEKTDHFLEDRLQVLDIESKRFTKNSGVESGLGVD